MILKIIGRSEVSFTDDKGRDVRGVSLYVLFPDERVDGQKAEKLFCKQGIADGVKPGDVVQVNFDMRGKVESISKDSEATTNGTTLKLNK